MDVRTAARALPLLVLVLVTGGCGNGSSGGGGGPGPGGDTEAPLVTVSFPTDGALTDAIQVTVRGTAGDPSGVRSIRVNGVVATSADGFSTWQATVPLGPGANTLRVRAEDEEGNVDTAAIEWTVTRAEDRVVVPTALALDPARLRLLVVDAALDRVTAVDLGSGAVATLSDAGTSGIAFSSPSGADVDVARDRVIVVDRGRRELVAVALADGARSVLSSGVGFEPLELAVQAALDAAYVATAGGLVVVDLADGSRTPLGAGVIAALGGVAVDAARGRVLVTRTAPSPALLAFDDTTGAVSVVSGGGIGTGDPLIEPRDVVLDPGLALALVSDAGAESIVAVDLVTGNRSRVSDAGLGGGIPLRMPGQLLVDPFGALDVVDTGLDALLAVGLASGDRDVILGTSVGAGVPLSQPVDIVPHGAGAVVLDLRLRALVEIDQGLRTFLTGHGIGTGPELAQPVALVQGPEVAPGIGSFLVADLAGAAVVSVDLHLQPVRRELSGPSVGNGPLFVGPRGVALLQPVIHTSGTSFAVVVADCPPIGAGRLIGVDVANGNRVVVSDDVTGSGPALGRPAAIASLGGGHVLVLDEAGDALFDVDVATGDRTLVSESGQGPAFDGNALKGLHVEPGAQRALVADSGSGLVLAVDLTSGTRTILSGGGAGLGPRLVAPVAVAIGPAPLFSGGGGAAVPTLTVVDLERGAVLVVDPDGDRVLWAK